LVSYRESRDVPIGIKARARHTSFGDVDAQPRRQCLHVGVFTAEASLPTMGHYDLIGFQTEIDAANFARYLRKECGMLSRDPFTT
jgi:hypothetical protein